MLWRYTKEQLRSAVTWLKDKIANDITLYSQSNKKDWKWKCHGEKKRIFELIDEAFSDITEKGGKEDDD